MVLSSIGNITVLVLLLKRRFKRPSRVDTMLTHLAIADLLVTFIMMPLEIGWAWTVSASSILASEYIEIIIFSPITRKILSITNIVRRYHGKLVILCVVWCHFCAHLDYICQVLCSSAFQSIGKYDWDISGSNFDNWITNCTAICYLR